MARPLEEKSRALIDALGAFTTEGKHPTRRELAARSLVGMRAANVTVANLVRAGHVEIKGTKREPYCNKPVAVYGFPEVSQCDDAGSTLGAALRTWWR